MQWEEYRDAVLDYLEFLGYPEYVADYNPEDVAETLMRAASKFFHLNISYRMCALSIFGLTWWKLKEGIGIDKKVTH